MERNIQQVGDTGVYVVKLHLVFTKISNGKAVNQWEANCIDFNVVSFGESFYHAHYMVRESCEIILQGEFRLYGEIKSELYQPGAEAFNRILSEGEAIDYYKYGDFDLDTYIENGKQVAFCDHMAIDSNKTNIYVFK